MFEIVDRNKQKITYFFIISLIGTILLLLALSFKNDDKVLTKTRDLSSINVEIDSIKEFLLSQIQSPFTNINYKIQKGDTIQKILKKYQIDNREIYNIINKYKKYGNPSKLLSGNTINIVIEKKLPENKNSITKFFLPLTNSSSIEITKDEDNNFVSKKIITKLYKKTVLADNIIKKNLYSSAVEAKINPDAIIEFARIFGFEIDFQRDIRKNDSFQIVYEEYKNDENKTIDYGNILYANLILQGRSLELYHFSSEKEKINDHFDSSGQSIKKTLMKTPINGARLSSGFGNRKHPILGYTKLHTGTDFAAPMGTPIMASGSGLILKAGWCGGGGNCVKIKHNNTYKTVYAHMSKFAKGIKKGVRVTQGQIIGYVGSTGMSTGPHLHYEVIKNGKKINSQKLKLPSGKKLTGKSREDFELAKIKIDVLKAELINN